MSRLANVKRARACDRLVNCADERSTALHLRPFVRLVLWRRAAGLGGSQGRRARAAHARRRVVAAADAVAREHAQLYQASRRARRADERPAVRRAVLERPPVRSRARARIAARRRRRAGRAGARRDQSAADAARHPARALRARPARRAPGDLARGGRRRSGSTPSRSSRHCRRCPSTSTWRLRASS